MDVTKPSLELLRQLSDEHVLAALMDQGRLTRAELATRTGISKPTVGESVRRLETAGVVVDTGQRTTGRGRIGSYYALAADVGCALAMSITPDGVAAEIVDAHTAVVARTVQPVTRPAKPDDVAAAIIAAAHQVRAGITAPVRLAVVSAADPVRRDTGRLVHLPDAPFLLGELSPVDVLAGLVDGPVLVDNDVHWAARAEQAAAHGGPSLDDFVYVYLGEGLGCAVVSDGAVRRGHSGIAGEIAHLITCGPDGRAVALIDVFADLGLRHHNSTAIDVAALVAAVTGTSKSTRTTRDTLATAICGILAAAIALADPAVVILGGSWGTNPTVLQAVEARCKLLARPVSLRPAAVTHEAALTGARTHAITQLRQAITQYRSHPHPEPRRNHQPD